MKISFPSFCYKSNIQGVSFKSNPVAFKGVQQDTFEKAENKTFDPEKLLKTLNGDFRKLNKEFFDNLSDEEYQFCLDWAKGDEKKFSGMFLFSPKAVLPEDVDGILKYSDFYYSGLKKIAQKENVGMDKLFVVGIGQSPVSTIKALELAGLNTAFCPISGLTKFNEPISKYVNKNNIDKYFSKWKNFGFDLDKLFGDNLIIFTDHKETGATINVFKKIMSEIIKIKKSEPENSGKKTAKIKFLPLSDIYKLANKDNDDKAWGRDFEDSVYHTSYLKTLYSPLFKLPLQEISKIEEYRNSDINLDSRIRFNKLTVLLYNSLYHKPISPDTSRVSSLKKDREFRLSFYTPD